MTRIFTGCHAVLTPGPHSRAPDAALCRGRPVDSYSPHMTGQNPRPDELRISLTQLYDWRQNHLQGDEKGEAQLFLDRLVRGFGHDGVREAGATLEFRLKKNDSKGTAFADMVWKPRCLVEMKRAGTVLKRHYRQAFDYWIQAVPNRPRYVVLCNFDEFQVYDFDQQLDAPVDTIALADLADRWTSLSFLLPNETEPQFGNNLVAVTREAARNVAGLFHQIHARGTDRLGAQRFVLQCVMAMFSEDVGLLPGPIFSRAVFDSIESKNPEAASFDLLPALFRELNTPGTTAGGRFKDAPYFNGGLFATVIPVELTRDELSDLAQAATTDWSAVRPEIFGTLFEQSMDHGERHAHGAHFTSQADIAKVVIPTIVDPWRRRIAEARTRGRGGIASMERLLQEIYSYRVLDPACGSGNFLYVAYRELRRLEHDIIVGIEEMRSSQYIASQRSIGYVTPDHFFGIDVNPIAIEIAKVTLLLGKKLASDELEDDQRILPLDSLDESIVAGDALFMEWPACNAIIGNPPYLGRRRMTEELGAGYCQELMAEYPAVTGVSDYVSYWFPLAHDHLPNGGRAGFVATNTIRENDSRRASLDYIVDNGGRIVDAVTSQPWSGDAVVDVSIVNWVKDSTPGPGVLWLNDGDLRLEVDSISSSLSAALDVRNAVPILANRGPGGCSQGQTPGVTRGFVLDAQGVGALFSAAQAELDVLHPFLGGRELLNRLSVDRWIIDIPDEDAVRVRAKYRTVMAHLEKTVLPPRQELVAREARQNAEGQRRSDSFRPDRTYESFISRWWQLWRRRPEFLGAVSGLDRYIATSRHATVNRRTVFEFVDSSIRPGDAITAFAFEDDYSFGILSSSLHHDWLIARCSTIRGDPRYTSTTVWDSFPWPQTPNASQVSRVVAAAKTLCDVRSAYLKQGVTLAEQYDSLILPGSSDLRRASEALDAAVYEAYGFSHGDDALAQILALNQDLASEPDLVRGPGPGEFEDVRVTDHRLQPPALPPGL